MGSAWIRVLGITFSIFGIIGSPMESGEKVKTTFQTQEAVKAWAGSAFFGGYTIAKFQKGNVEALIVIGSHSGGIPSSETHVFCKTKNGQYTQILFRQSVPGILIASETSEGIEIRTQKNRTVLLIPWHGIAEDFDYFDNGK